MTSSIGFAAAFGNVAVVLALATALANPRVSGLARLTIVTFAFTLAWLMTAAFDETRAPGWTVAMGGAVIVVSLVVVIATLHRWTQASDRRHRADEGGSGPQRHWPDVPRGGGGGSEPGWWPDFERQLAVYVAERQREKRQPSVLPG